MSLQEALARVESRYRELTDALSDPAVLSQPKQMTKVAKERASLAALIQAAAELREVEKQIAGNEELMRAGDAEMAALANAELPDLTARRDALAEQGPAAAPAEGPQRRQERDPRDPRRHRRRGGRAVRRRDLPHVPEVRRSATAGSSRSCRPRRPRWAASRKSSPRSTARARTPSSSSNPASTASSACPRPRPRAASTPPPRRSPCCPRPRTWTSRSRTTRSWSTSIARAAPAARTSTRPTRRCASTTCRPA